MGKCGPQPEGKLEILTSSDIKRPEPFPDMLEGAKVVWNRIVSSFAPDYFRPQNLDMLRAFCEAVALHTDAVARIGEQGAVIVSENGTAKRNPWCQERDNTAAIMASLATKLSINKNSTALSRNKASEGQAQDDRRAGLLYGG